MNPLLECINSIYYLIIGEIPTEDETLIKLHTRYLEKLGDISLPLPMKNWYHLVEKTTIVNNESDTIFKYKMDENNVETAIETIIHKLQELNMKIRTYRIIKSSAHLFFERPSLFSFGIKEALTDRNLYGKMQLFTKSIKLVANETTPQIEDADLSTLRLLILKNTIENLLDLTANTNSTDVCLINISQNIKNKSVSNILCGPVVNEKGMKDITHKASDFFNKRISDMQLMAQHRYRVNIKSTSEWNECFNRLGRASVTIELLSNKPHKSVKITLNNLSGANKGPSFIFYNCARLSILLKEFDNKVSKGVYPSLPDLDKIDFTLLNQPEEWELLYTYILQYQCMIKNCIRGIESGNVNPQHLVTFLSSLSSVFSVYYRRVRILTCPRDHMFGTIFSRIYLLKALQCVFHNALKIINIEPVTEM